MWHRVISSNVKKVSYRKGSLKVEFHRGGRYRYIGVPKQVFIQIKKAESPGKFLNTFIKGVYSFEKLPDSFWKRKK